MSRAKLKLGKYLLYSTMFLVKWLFLTHGLGGPGGAPPKEPLCVGSGVRLDALVRRLSPPCE